MGKRHRKAERATQQRKPCMLCGRTDLKITNEHLYGDWLTGVMKRIMGRQPETTRRTFNTEVDHKTGEVVTTADRMENGDHFRRKYRILCTDCNGVWGSQLETAMIPIMERMLDLQGPIMITPDESLVLARW